MAPLHTVLLLVVACVAGVARAFGPGPPPPPPPIMPPSVACDGEYTCAHFNGEKLYCWGKNSLGQLGDGTTTNRGTPAPVAAGGLSTTRQVAAGVQSACALLSSGEVYCWGWNVFGTVGDGTGASTETPTFVMGGAAQLTVGNFQACALQMTGAVKCWGDNSLGQVGDDSMEQRNSPVDVTGLSANIQLVRAGRGHTCAINTTGHVLCWGSNVYGHVGDGTTTQRNAPVATLLDAVAKDLALGDHFTCALAVNGSVFCWGRNSDSQLGDGTCIAGGLTTAASWATAPPPRAPCPLSSRGSPTWCTWPPAASTRAR